MSWLDALFNLSEQPTSRRSFLKTSAALVAGAVTTSSSSQASASLLSCIQKLLDVNNSMAALTDVEIDLSNGVNDPKEAGRLQQALAFVGGVQDAARNVLAHYPNAQEILDGWVQAGAAHAAEYEHLRRQVSTRQVDYLEARGAMNAARNIQQGAQRNFLSASGIPTEEASLLHTALVKLYHNRSIMEFNLDVLLDPQAMEASIKACFDRRHWIAQSVSEAVHVTRSSEAAQGEPQAVDTREVRADPSEGSIRSRQDVALYPTHTRSLKETLASAIGRLRHQGWPSHYR